MHVLLMARLLLRGAASQGHVGTGACVAWTMHRQGQCAVACGYHLALQRLQPQAGAGAVGASLFLGVFCDVLGAVVP